PGDCVGKPGNWVVSGSVVKWFWGLKADRDATDAATDSAADAAANSAADASGSVVKDG
ncbi:hypothetical protein FCV25MIE_09176, partial [Fagus crenata]